MKFLNDKFHTEVKPKESRFEGLDALSKKSGLSFVRFPNQTKYVIIPLTSDGEWLPPNVGLEKFMRFTVEECIDVINDAVSKRLPASTYADIIKSHFELEDKNAKWAD